MLQRVGVEDFFFNLASSEVTRFQRERWVAVRLFLSDPVTRERRAIDSFSSVDVNDELIAGLGIRENEISATAGSGVDHSRPGVSFVEFTFQTYTQVGASVTGKTELIETRAMSREDSSLCHVTDSLVYSCFSEEKPCILHR